MYRTHTQKKNSILVIPNVLWYNNIGMYHPTRFSLTVNAFL